MLVKQKPQSKQEGFMVLLIMLMLVLGAAVWFGTISSLRAQHMQIEMHDEHIRELHQIKQKMLAFAVMQPEVYYTEASGSPNFDQIPGPGYFPCPDTDGDGLPNNGPSSPCGSNDGFVTGIVPIKSSDNRYTFINSPEDSSLYWFSIDSRFVTSNSVSSHRFLPLNLVSPANANLTVDGRDDIVMVLFYAGDPLAGQNRSSVAQNAYLDQGNADNNSAFFTKDGNSYVFNDYVISITLDEWRAAILSRVSKDVTSDDNDDGFADDENGDGLPDREQNKVADLCKSKNVRDNENHWFNRCLFNSTPSFVGNDTETDIDKTCEIDISSVDENRNGQNWNELLCN